MDGHSSLRISHHSALEALHDALYKFKTHLPWAPGSNLVVRVNRAIHDWPGIQQEVICYQWFKHELILSISEPSISQWAQIKEDTVEPSVPTREFNLKAYAAVTWHNDPASLGLEPRLADHRSQAARTAMLPIAPPGKAKLLVIAGLFHVLSLVLSRLVWLCLLFTISCVSAVQVLETIYYFLTQN